MTPLKRLLPCVVLACGLPMAVLAQQRYESWQRPGNDLSGFIEQLGKLVDEAERARAADPRFLSDLRALMRRHERPWSVSLVTERFADGDFTQNPAWTVGRGSFQVLREGGLYSELSARTEQAAAQAGQSGGDEGKPRAEDLAVALLSQLLSQNQGGSGGNGAAPASQAPLQPAEIYLLQPVTPAFAVSAVIAAPAHDAGFEFGLFQGIKQRSIGYRLVIGGNDAVVLYRLTRSGPHVLQEASLPVSLKDRGDHVIEWTRDGDGGMSVAVDGRTVLQVNDRTFQDPFDGLHVFNRGGEYILRSITVDGTG